MAIATVTETWTAYESPLGPLALSASEDGLNAIRFPGRGLPRGEPTPGALGTEIGQLEEYFRGERTAFELKLDVRGTPFQQAVWAELLRIPHGATITYGEIARRIGRPDRARAVGAAVGRTPIPIVIPCHRVLGANGSLTGYGGGLERKAALLALEGATLPVAQKPKSG